MRAAPCPRGAGKTAGFRLGKKHGGRTGGIGYKSRFFPAIFHKRGCVCMCCLDFLSLVACNSCLWCGCNACRRDCRDACNCRANSACAGEQNACRAEAAYRSGYAKGYRYGADLARSVYAADHSFGTPWHCCRADAAAFNGGYARGFRGGVDHLPPNGRGDDACGCTGRLSDQG